MALHLLPDPGYDPIAEMEEIRIFPDDPEPQTPHLHDWISEPKGQIITHVSTGCRFHAYRLKAPLVNGLVLPFKRSYEIAVKFKGMLDNAPLPEREHLRELGRQGIAWILTYTFESSRRRT